MKKNQIIFLILTILVLGLGVFFRFWQLDSIPPGIQYDEAFNGINAISANETGHYQVFYTENFGREGFHINATAMFIKLFGVSNLSLRLANALWGSLALFGFYLLLKKLKLTPLSVLLGTFMLAFSFWHLDFSRTAYRAIMVPMLIIWIIYFFLAGLESKKKWNWKFFASGALLGLGFHTYIAFRIFPLAMIILAVVISRLKKNFWRDYYKTALLYFSISLIVAMPILIYFYGHQTDLLNRTEVVSIFDDPKASHWESFKKSFTVHINAFFFIGDKNPRHNYNQNPLLPAPLAAVFMAGFLTSFYEIGKNIRARRRYKKDKNNAGQEFIPSAMYIPSVVAQTVFWIMLIPGILSYEGIPHTLRIIGTIPAVYLFCVLPFGYLEKSISKLPREKKFPNFRMNRQILLWSLVVAVAVTGLLQPYIYFKLWAPDAQTVGGFEKKLYDLGNLINELPLHKNNYLITGYNAAVNKEHTQTSYKTTEYIAYPKIKSYQDYRPMDGRTAINCDDTLVVFQDCDQWLRSQYMANCPGLRQKVMLPKGGLYAFWVLSY